MKKLLVLILCILVLHSFESAFTEEVQPLDYSENYLVFLEGNLKHRCDPSYSTLCSRIVSYCPQFKNISTRSIVGIKLDVDFVDSFGDVIVQQKDLKIQDKIKPKGKNRCAMFWLFNRHNKNYSKLAEGADNKTIKTVAKVKTIVFKDGEVRTFQIK